MNVFTKNLSGLKCFSFKRAGFLLFDPLYNYNMMKMVLIIIVIFLFIVVYPKRSKEIQTLSTKQSIMVSMTGNTLVQETESRKKMDSCQIESNQFSLKFAFQFPDRELRISLTSLGRPVMHLPWSSKAKNLILSDPSLFLQPHTKRQNAQVLSMQRTLTLFLYEPQ